ncbi:MAG: hypothetical protein ACXVJJ_05810 [Halobacteriota archaeon]
MDANIVALAALPILAVFLAFYLLRVDDNVGHLFVIMGVGLVFIALLPYILKTESSIGSILAILGLGCVAWGLTLRRKRFRLQKHTETRKASK